ncbi:hypothetical protein DRE_00408 [Drechslerella stenobrocha 248]|uniref:Uncharacterized protein n=1 Tax=Drechslerella stenobrocha 248 TaxID=1043628 RepID=W7IEJ2_9PEZI|nr:hypothetical protein DRE_00408 [Drechslerella stenobrocha 248]
MGFLKPGRRSLRTSANTNSSVDTSSSSTPMASGADGITALQPGSSPLERLPVELLQQVFLLSYNPKLALSSRYLLNNLSSPYLHTEVVCSAILDDGLSKDEYRAIMADFLTRRFFTREFLLRIEAKLWDGHFRELFAAVYPGAHEDPYKLWTLLTPSPPSLFPSSAPERPQIHHISPMEQRMACGMLDLRTIRFPLKRLLLPPYSVEKTLLLLHLADRTDRPLIPEHSDQESYDVALDAYNIAVGRRCSAMVAFILHQAHMGRSWVNPAAALLPPCRGQTWSGADPLHEDGPVDQRADVEALKMVITFVSCRRTDPPYRYLLLDEFLQAMREWESGDPDGMLLRMGWSEYSADIAHGLRVIWAMIAAFKFKNGDMPGIINYDESHGYCNRVKLMALPWSFGKIKFLAERNIWEAALHMEDKGLLKWMISATTPPDWIRPEGLSEVSADYAEGRSSDL